MPAEKILPHLNPEQTDGQKTESEKRDRVSHMRTRSLDRTSPRVRKAGNRGSPVTNRIRIVDKNLEVYLPKKWKKKSSVKRPESPLYSPGTLDALTNAEKLIKEAQTTILEASYDVHSSPERESSIDFAGHNDAHDEEEMYIRDIVATRFYEANEAGRIFTRPSARPLNDRRYKPQIRQKSTRKIIEQIDQICSEELTTSPRLRMKTKRWKRPFSKIRDKFHNQSIPEGEYPMEKNSAEANEADEMETEECLIQRENSYEREKEMIGKNFKVQEGPRIHIRSALSMTNVEKINIFPSSTLLPVQCNSKKYEFRHESHLDKIAEGDSEPTVNKSSWNEPEIDEKSGHDTDKNPVVDLVASNLQPSKTDLVENKSDQSHQPELAQEPKDTRKLIPETEKNQDKIDDRGESFIDFLQRAGSDDNKLPIDTLRHKDLSQCRDRTDNIDLFNQVVRQFFHDFRLADDGQRNLPVEKDSVDGKSFEDPVVEKSNGSIENEFSVDFQRFEDSLNPEDVNLEPPNVKELDNVLKKFDGTMNKIFHETRKLGLLISEYASQEENSELSKNYSISENTSMIDRERFNAAGGTSLNGRNKSFERNYEDKELKNNSQFKDSSIEENYTTTDKLSTEFFQSRYKSAEKKLSINDVVGNKIDSRLKYSTPLKNDFRIDRLSRNFEDYNSNEFTNCFDTMDRSKLGSDQSYSRKLFPMDKMKNDKTVTSGEEIPVRSIRVHDDLEEKKMVLNEIQKKCNFESLFNRDGSIHNKKNNETNQSITFPRSSSRYKYHCGSRSLIEELSVRRNPGVRENLFDAKRLFEEFSKKQTNKCSSSAAEKCVESSRDKSTSSKLSRTKTLVENKISIRLENVDKKKHSEEGSEVMIQATMIIPAVEEMTNKDAAKNGETKNLSGEEKKTKSQNPVNDSPGSSVKDRTSFDISNVYSEDFEEPTEKTQKSNSQEKSISRHESIIKSISNELALSDKEDIKMNKSKEDKIPESSVSISNKTKKESDYSRESKSPSEMKQDERNNVNKTSKVESHLESAKSNEKKSSDKSLEKKKNEEQKTSDENSSDSSKKIPKVYRESSLAEDVHSSKVKVIDTCTENYSDGELYLPSSCSYSLGEIRISEMGTRGTSGAGVDSSLKNSDGLTIFVSKSFVNIDSPDNTVDSVDSPIQSLGEIDETDVESIDGSHAISDDQQQRNDRCTCHSGNKYKKTLTNYSQDRVLL